MFNNNRYLIRGVQLEIPLELQLFMWDCISKMTIERDYLQVFKLSSDGKLQTVVHSQEQPEYQKSYSFIFPTHINAKVFVIDDGDHSTMLLAEEY